MPNPTCPICQQQLYAPVTPLTGTNTDGQLDTRRCADIPLTDELQLKQYCRDGLMSKHRPMVYTNLVQQNSTDGCASINALETEYKQYKQMWLNGNDEKIVDVLPAAYIPLFGLEVYQQQLHTTVILDTTQMRQLKLVLCVLKYRYVEVSYAPQVVYVAAQLIKLYDDPATVYALLCTMIQRSKVGDWYMHVGYGAAYRAGYVINNLVKHRFKQTYKHLQTLQFDLITFSMLHMQSMLSSLFTESSTLWHIMDAWMNEGDKVLTRIMLATIMLNKPQIKKCATVQQVIALLSATQYAYDIRRIIRVAFEQQLSRADLDEQSKRAQIATYAQPSMPTQLFHLLKRTESDILSAADMFAIYQLLPAARRISDFQQLYSNAKHGYNYKSVLKCCSEAKPAIILIRDTASQVFGIYLSKPIVLNDSKPTVVDTDTFVFAVKPNIQQYTHQKSVSSAPDSDYCHKHQPSTQLPRRSKPSSTSSSSSSAIVPSIAVDESAILTVTDVCKAAEVGRHEAFVIARDDMLVIGDVSGAALAVDAQLKYAYSQRCAAFASAPLFTSQVVHSNTDNKLLVTNVAAIEVYTL